MNFKQSFAGGSGKLGAAKTAKNELPCRKMDLCQTEMESLQNFQFLFWRLVMASNSSISLTLSLSKMEKYCM